ncbi:DegV family protein, partial [Erysipelothrix rhusiopathiae]|nr:DegV family protein [Erysipelothrix rhusiopathiae]
CDSSVCFTPEKIKKYNVFIAPLTLIHNNTEYLDQETISKEEVSDYILILKDGVMKKYGSLKDLKIQALITFLIFEKDQYYD